MKYVYINPDLSTGSIVSDFDPAFPGVPITERFSVEFLSHCVVVDDDAEVGAFYNPITKQFYSGGEATRDVYEEIEQIKAEYDTLILDLSFRTTLLELGVN